MRRFPGDEVEGGNRYDRGGRRQVVYETSPNTDGSEETEMRLPSRGSRALDEASRSGSASRSTSTPSQRTTTNVDMRSMLEEQRPEEFTSPQYPSFVRSNTPSSITAAHTRPGFQTSSASHRMSEDSSSAGYQQQRTAIEPSSLLIGVSASQEKAAAWLEKQEVMLSSSSTNARTAPQASTTSSAASIRQRLDHRRPEENARSSTKSPPPTSSISTAGNRKLEMHKMISQLAGEEESSPREAVQTPISLQHQQNSRSTNPSTDRVRFSTANSKTPMSSGANSSNSNMPVSSSSVSFKRGFDDESSLFSPRSVETATSTNKRSPPIATTTFEFAPSSEDLDELFDSNSKSLAQKKADRFLSVADTVLVEDRVLEQDPRALATSNCRVYIRSFRGTYLRKSPNGNHGITGGTLFDSESSEFVLEKHSQIPSKVFMYGDSVFVRLANSSGLYLSGSEFTRESRGTWTLRRYIDNNDKSKSSRSSSPKDYVSSCDAIVLEYDSNKRVLGCPNLPSSADGEGSSEVSLEISPLEVTQSWYLVRSLGRASVFMQTPSVSIGGFEFVEDDENETVKTVQASRYLMDTLLGLYGCSATLERRIESDQELILIAKLRPLVDSIQFLKSYCSVRVLQPEYGSVAQALSCFLLEKVVDPFEEFVSTLAFESSSPSMTFLFNALQPRSRQILDWTRVLKQVQNKKGAGLLNGLNDLKLGEFEIPRECEQALSVCLHPYLKILHRWLSEGVIHDPFDEFLVCEHLQLRENTLNEKYNALYWERRFTLRAGDEAQTVPWFLKKLTKKILHCGRDLNANKLCLNKNSSMASQTAMRFRLDDLHLKTEETINAFYVDSSQALMKRLFVDCSILERLRFFKQYFLLERGDFFVYFLEVAGRDLHAKVRSSSSSSASMKTRLDTLLHVAIRESDSTKGNSVGQSPTSLFGDDLTCILLPYAVDTHVDKIHQQTEKSTSSSLMNDSLLAGTAASDMDNTSGIGMEDELLGIDAFALDIDSSSQQSTAWPINLVFTRKVLTKYQLLFRHLFRSKHAERVICQAWLTIRKAGGGMMDQTSQSLILRMLQFLQSFQYYQTFEVIEPRWLEFMKKVKTVTCIDDLLRLHEDFLDMCLRECLLANPNLVRTLSRLLRLCLSLGDLLAQEDYDIVPVRCDPIRLSEFDHEYGMFLQQLRSEAEKGQYRSEHLLNLRTRLDFSDFYGVV